METPMSRASNQPQMNQMMFMGGPPGGRR
jgi:hypothetical protein